MITILRHALYLMGPEARRRWWLLLSLAVSASLVEVVAAALIYTLLGLVADPNGEVSLPLIGSVRRLAGNVGHEALLLQLVGAMAGFFVFRAALALVTEYVTSRVIQNTAARLSARLVRGYLGLPLSFHLRHNSAELIRNSQQVTLELSNSVFNPLVRIGAEAVLVVGIFALLLLVSPLGTALAVAVVGGMSVLLLTVIQPRLKRLGRTAHALHKETLASQQQCFNGVRDIKMLGREDAFAGAYANARHRLARMLYLRSLFASLTPVVMDLALIGFILVFFAITVTRSAPNQGMLAVLGLFAYAGLRLQPSLKVITSGLNSLKFAAVPASDLFRDVQLIEQQPPMQRLTRRRPLNRDIVLEGVGFRYECADSDAVSGIDLTIRRGEQIGICGPTGSGKSTLIDIITGLLTPSTGRVLVDGRDIADDVRSWQLSLGMVPQTVFLTDDTLTHNIALGVPEGEIDQNTLLECIQLAQLDSFVQSLPESLGTVVGERGVRLSGGERQRIAIARALYNHPEVLILDEGTSALDNLTEHELMSALTRLRGSRTVLLVAHRLSTVRDCDRVVFIEEGRIAGVGTFEELLKSNPTFEQMNSAG